ncbi:MAG: metalloregulator ArsR/SmtB family transcription factor [Gemmatimonadota bacterium]
MPRTAAATDVYSAIAEPRRRAIFAFVCAEERSVNEVVEGLRMDQPSVSKHLRILREVDLVHVRQEGRRRFYSANRDALDPVQSWISECERLWHRHLDAIQERAESGRASRPHSHPSNTDQPLEDG